MGAKSRCEATYSCHCAPSSSKLAVEHDRGIRIAHSNVNQVREVREVGRPLCCDRDPNIAQLNVAIDKPPFGHHMLEHGDIFTADLFPNRNHRAIWSLCME